MKKKLMLLFILACSMVIAGCGKSDHTDKEEVSAEIVEEDEAETTETDAEETGDETEEKNAENAAEDEGVLVEMIVDNSPRSAGNIGQPGAEMDSLSLVNRLGKEILYLYIRPSEDEDWGENRMDGSFTFGEGLSAALYFEREILDEAGEKAESFDLQVGTDESTYYFRNIPFYSIMQLTLRTVDTYDGSIPYATYLKLGSVNEESTIQAVLDRLGLTEADLPGGIPQVGDQTAAAEDAAAAEEETPRTPGVYTSDPNAANELVGQDASKLVEALGEPQDGLYYSDSGTQGFYYYTDYTVYTSVDESGKEVVDHVEW